MVSLVCWPLMRPTAAVKTAPQANDNTTTRRATGKPSPGAWLQAGDRPLGSPPCLAWRPRAIHDLDRPSVPVPGRRHLLLEPLAALLHQAVEQRFRKPLARLAVPPGERRTGCQALRDARRIEPSDRGTAGGVIAVDLTQEGTERHHRGEDAVT